MIIIIIIIDAFIMRKKTNKTKLNKKGYLSRIFCQECKIIRFEADLVLFTFIGLALINLLLPANSLKINMTCSILKERNGRPSSTAKVSRTAPSRDDANIAGDVLSESTLNSDVRSDSTAHCSSAACTIDYETRDGSAKHGKDYCRMKGTLVSFVTE